jgi:hypothetical protein
MMDHSVSVKQRIETHTVWQSRSSKRSFTGFLTSFEAYYDRLHEVRIGNEEARREITGAIPDQAVKLDIA